MTVSGTLSFNPSLGSLALNALARAGVRRTEITQQHMNDVYYEANLMQSRWAADGMLLWTVDTATITLIQGTGSYSVSSNVVMITDLYITISNGNNRYITPFSRTDYASLANPAAQGVPTSYWFDRTLSPTVTFWPVPDGNETSATYYYYRRIDDATLPGGVTPEIPYYWLDAYAAGLAHRLARIYNPQVEAQRKADADEAYLIACKQGGENTPVYIAPGLQGYYRP